MATICRLGLTSDGSGMSMMEPGVGESIAGVSLPSEFYWVLRTPAPLAGMKYPRGGFPWGELARVGFSRLVALHPGNYDPSPLTILSTEHLQDLVGGGPPSKPIREQETIANVGRPKHLFQTTTHTWGGRSIPRPARFWS